MYRKKIALLFAAVLVILMGAFAVSAAGLADQKAVLSGEIVSVVRAGTLVEEGAELARVSTLAGSATAARANVKGVVREVLVQPGSTVRSGDVIVRIEVE